MKQVGAEDFIVEQNMPVTALARHVRYACGLDLPWVDENAETGSVSIVAGGPSIKDSLGELAARKQQGETIWAANGAHDFLIDNNIIPSAMVMMDGSDILPEAVENPRADITYLVASQCAPGIFEALEGYPVKVWHVYADFADPILARDGRECYMVGGGGTIGLRAMNLAATMGYELIHVYGIDSSYGEGELEHAYPSRGDAAAAVDVQQGRVLDVRVGKRTFKARPWMIRQALDFQAQVKTMLAADIKIAVHGDGLIPHMAGVMAGVMANQTQR
jgi:hypothetical protein